MAPIERVSVEHEHVLARREVVSAATGERIKTFVDVTDEYVPRAKNERLREALGRIASTEAPLSQNDLQIARDALDA